jgi:hypothetical protein
MRAARMDSASVSPGKPSSRTEAGAGAAGEGEGKVVASADDSALETRSTSPRVDGGPRQPRKEEGSGDRGARVKWKPTAFGVLLGQSA